MWLDRITGWMARCGQILAQPPEGVGGRLRSLLHSQLLSSQRLESETGS